jgi:hypothetical protein
MSSPVNRVRYWFWLRRVTRLMAKLDPADRVVWSPRRPPLVPQPRAQHTADMKPEGLWYSFGSEWPKWCLENMPGWINRWRAVYRITVQESRLLRINNEREFLAFDNIRPVGNLPGGGPPYAMLTDWTKIAQKYPGMEITPYLWKFRLSHMWYYPWDVASGTIWDPKVILNVETLLVR